MRDFLNQRLKSLPFWLVHVLALGVFVVPFSWKMVALCVGTYSLRMFGITAGYHRYFSHRSYKLGRAAQFVMAWIGAMSMQKGPLWWAAHHRHHHKFSDQEQDLHSPVQRGFWWSHAGWILSERYNGTEWEQIQDFAKYPELRWLNRWDLVPAFSLLGLLLVLGGPAAAIWGFVLSTVLLWHGTFFINSLAHVWGSRRYETSDTSRNNFLLSLVTLGEGWHNNHHTYMSSTRQGFLWWEIDVSYYVLKGLSWMGVARDLREPPLEKLEARRVGREMAPLRPVATSPQAPSTSIPLAAAETALEPMS